MDGVVYFGPHTLSLERCKNAEDIDLCLEVLKETTAYFGNCHYASLNVPEDWADIRINGSDFFQRVEEVTNDDQALGVFLSNLYDGTFNSLLDKNLSYHEVLNRITSNNPNSDLQEYYGALKLGEPWPDIDDDLHISDQNSLFRFALKFLKEHPVSSESYARRCEKLFANLTFLGGFENNLHKHGEASKHSNYGKAPTSGIRGFSHSVTACLYALNSTPLENMDTREILSNIQARSGFECTGQGSNKNHLKFEIEGTSVNCEFHLKISKNNSDDGVYYQDRIYFGFQTIGDKREIVIAHSGQHL